MEKTVEVMGYFGKPKQITRANYVARWAALSADLMFLGIDVREETKRKAGEEWDRIAAVQKVTKD